MPLPKLINSNYSFKDVFSKNDFSIQYDYIHNINQAKVDKLQKAIRPTPGWLLGTGTASGIMGGLFGMHGPPVVLYLTVSEPDKDHYMGMIQTYAVITNITMLVARACNGYVTPFVRSTYLYGLIGLAIGVIAGNWAYSRIPNRIFTYLVYAYIGISGIIIFLTV